MGSAKEWPIQQGPVQRPDRWIGRVHVARRVLAFLVERFPPGAQLVLMVVLFVAATTMSDVLLAPDLGGELGTVEWVPMLCGFLASLLFVVRLRVFDDVKDAETDRAENPTRPIPRGLVSVRELDATSVLILGVEAVLMWNVGPTSLVLWGAAAAWSVLMRVEFFVPEWLDRHIATYAISHMVVMGLLYGTLLAIGMETRGGDVGVIDLVIEPVVIVAMLAATSIGIGFEWGRKFERYLAVHGERGWSLWMLWPSMGVLAFTFLARSEYPVWAVMALTVVSLATFVVHALIMGQREHPEQRGAIAAPPTGKLRDAVEAAPGVAGLLVYLVLAIAGVTVAVGG